MRVRSLEIKPALFRAEAHPTASVMYHHTFRSRPMPGKANSAAPADNMTGMDMSNMPGMSHNSNTPIAQKPNTTPQKPMKDMPGMAMGEKSGMGSSAPASAAQKAMPMKPMSSMPGMHMAPEPTLDLSTTAVWGRTRSLSDNSKENSYLFEALLRFASSNYAWTRMENAGRSNELLLTPGTPLPQGFAERPLGHVAAFTFGYDHDLRLGRKVLAAPGMQFTVYRTPAALAAVYGSTPTAETIFVRFRLR